MKFVTLKENLKQGLLIVAHLTSKNINLPILNNILIKARKEGIELISTNLEISINHFLRGKIEKEGEFTVDSKIISEYISLLPEDKIEIERVVDDLNIRCQNYKTKIRGQVSGDFPVLPKINKDNDFYLVDIGELKKSLSSVIFSVSNNENRVELSGVFFKFKNDFLTIVGTDSYRLSEKTMGIKNNKGLDERSVIVPARTIQELIRILNNFKSEDQIETDNFMKINLTDNQVFFSFGSTKLSSRLIIGNYPDYEQIIPQKERTNIEVDKGLLVRAVKSAGIFSKTGINDIGLEIRDKKIIISSSSSQTGENIVEIDAIVSGDDNEVFVNYKYFLEGLNNIDSDKIIIKATDNNTPCILKSESDDSFLYLVMPIKQ